MTQPRHRVVTEGLLVIDGYPDPVAIVARDEIHGWWDVRRILTGWERAAGFDGTLSDAEILEHNARIIVLEA